MQCNKVVFFLIQLVFFHNPGEFVEALVGRNVRRARQGEFPSAVCIVRTHDNPARVLHYVRCTGTLISHSHVLTSEHCLDNMGPEGLFVLAGSVDIRHATGYYIAWWITYNMWATMNNVTVEFYNNDIVMMKLALPVNRAIPHALVSQDNNTNLYGLEVSLAGWGLLANDTVPFILHTVQATIISNEDCEALSSRLRGGEPYSVPYRYLCTFADPFALLNSGDSGGPMIYGSVLIGVNQGTCPQMDTIIHPRKANLHCTVDYYRPFIEDTLLG